MGTSLCCIIFVSFIATNHRTKNQQQPWAIAKFTSGIKKLKWIPSSHFKNHPVLSLLLLSENKRSELEKQLRSWSVHRLPPKNKTGKMCSSSEIQPGWSVGRLVGFGWGNLRKLDVEGFCFFFGSWLSQLMVHPVSLGPKKPRFGPLESGYP